MQRRTRIVATLGPATDRPGVLEKLVEAGLDVARINFSHGNAEDHKRRIGLVRELSKRFKRPVAVLGDLPGPKLRVLLDKPLELTPGQTLRLPGDLHVTEPEALARVQPGQRLLLDDGRLQLRVTSPPSEGGVIHLEVIVGGPLLPNKGMNLPDTDLAIPAITERDKEAVRVAALVGVDWLALSFVRDASAAQHLRDAARSHGLRVPVLAKIERPEAVRHAQPIIAAFDAIMVARGDLGVEIAFEQVPHVQKDLIRLARAAGKPVITATDMLDSMRNNPRPTRAEAGDVANAVYDGTDAVMLSAETSVGDFPVEALQTMNNIILETERHLHTTPLPALHVTTDRIIDHVTDTVCKLARDINAKAIVAPAYSGGTVRLLARHRPCVPIIVPAQSEVICRQLSLVWGLQVVPFVSDGDRATDRLEDAVRSAFIAGGVHEGDRVVALAGHPIEGGERFPTIRVVRVGSGGISVEP